MGMGMSEFVLTATKSSTPNEDNPKTQLKIEQFLNPVLRETELRIR